MAKGSKLKQALEHYKGVDHKLEKQKKLRKEAEKKKKAKQSNKSETEGASDSEEEDKKEEKKEQKTNGSVELKKESSKKKDTAKANGVDKEPKDGEWETDESEDEEDEDDDSEKEQKYDLSRLEDSDSSSEEEDEEDESGDEEEEEDVPLSDLESVASEEKGDIIPHQRLTINNTAALTAALNRIALPLSKLPFAAHQSITAAKPTEIPDVEDDLNRELAFYSQALSAVKEAHKLLKQEGVPFTRPSDYFAEMVKSDEHMGKIKQKLIDEAANKKAAQEARRQRDLKKFGKAVQVAKLQERDKAKRETLERINTLKRKRQGAELENTHEGDLFDVALDEETGGKRERRGGAATGKPNVKRQKKNEKYGFGGKKRFAKSGDAQSSADMRGYSVKKMKGKTGAAKRPGKARRGKKI